MTSPRPLPVVEAADKFKAALLRKDAEALSRLIQAWGRSYQRLQSEIDALATAIALNEPTAGQVVRMARYKSLMRQVAEELRDLQALTREQVEIAGRLGVELGVKDARQLMSYAATGTPRIAAGFNQLPVDAVERLLGFLSPDSALYERIRLLAPTTTKFVSDKLVEGVALGLNPRRIASEIRGAYGKGLSDSLRMTRTVQLYSYREANRATYIANGDVVEGWYWFSALQPGRTCMSCVAMHGTFHTNDERLNDHHAGLCTSIPAVKGFPNPIKESGEQWFGSQGESIQRQMMGRGKFEAWTGGKFDISALTAVKENDVFGEMRVEQTLKALVGGG